MISEILTESQTKTSFFFFIKCILVIGHGPPHRDVFIHNSINILHKGKYLLVRLKLVWY